VLHGSQVKHPQRAIRANCRKDVLAPCPRDVVHLLVVGYELDLHLPLRQVPDRARCVDAAGADDVRVQRIPVEGGQGGTVLAVFVLRESGEKRGRGGATHLIDS
jgi:hypothetical protein